MKNTKKFLGILGVTVSLMSLLSSCAKKAETPAAAAATATTTTTTTTTESITSYPSGMAFSSPTASTSSVSALSVVQQGIEASSSAFDSTKSASVKKAAIDAIASATAIATCQITLPNFAANSTDPSCYGPGLDYENHLDWTAGGSANGQLPTGDLGIWTASESTTACSAAKINSEINKIASKVDTGMLLAAAATCVIKNTEGLALPAVDATTDILSAMNSAIQVNNTEVTFSTATVARGADVDSLPVYTYTFVLSHSGYNMDITLGLRHHPTAESNATYKGNMWGKFVPSSGNSNATAFSLSYEKASATSLKYHSLSANFNSGATPAPTYFTSENILKVAIASGETGWNGNIARAVVNLDPTTDTGFFSFAWQAGTGDSHARVFNGFTRVETDATKGYAYFGYGPKFNTTTGDYSDNTISNFVCNWAGPNNNHNANTGKAQKQIMTLTSGSYVNTTSFISYAPVNSCDMTAGQTNATNSGAFKYKLTSASYEATQPAVTNNLVTLASDTEYAIYQAAVPTVPASF